MDMSAPDLSCFEISQIKQVLKTIQTLESNTSLVKNISPSEKLVDYFKLKKKII